MFKRGALTSQHLPNMDFLQAIECKSCSIWLVISMIVVVVVVVVVHVSFVVVGHVSFSHGH